MCGNRTSCICTPPLVGVYLYLNGRVVANSSQTAITDIGEGDRDGLLCFTDLAQCCGDAETVDGVARGDWTFPNGSLVSSVVNGSGVYVDRGPGVVRLNILGSGGSPPGLFCCVIPDASLIMQTICTDIGESNSLQL